MLTGIASAQAYQDVPAPLQANSVALERLNSQIQPIRWLICTALTLSWTGFWAGKAEIPALARAMQNSS